MSVNAHIEISETDQLLELVNHAATILQDQPDYAAQQSAKVAEGKSAEVLAALVNVVPVYITSLAATELESVCNSLIHLVGMQPAADSAALLQKISAAVASSKVPGLAEPRLKILANLYNSLEQRNKLRYQIYVDILGHASNAGLLDALKGQIADVEKWLGDWGCDIAQKRNLYRLISQAYKKANQSSRSAEFLAKLMATYNGAAAAELEQVKADALALVATVLRSPEMYDVSHLLNLDGVKHLKGEKGFELLELYCKSDLETFQKWLAANAATVKQLELDEQELLRKVRLMALTSLCARSSSLDFAGIAKAIQIPEDDVESWIIDVIRADLVEAKLDELNARVVVSRSTHTAFRMEQWQDLQRKLQAWQGNLSEVQTALDNVQTQIRRQALAPGR
eukprot:m.74494 g.74494  ORF g.74494 m.74494 type:complete len:396 (+) comp14508_c0_seq1:135-1322(+)